MLTSAHDWSPSPARWPAWDARRALAGLAGARLQFHWRRVLVRGAIIVICVFALLFATLAGVTLLPTHFPPTVPITHQNPRVKHYYLALGDSLAFGFQPNFNWDQGYAMQWWSELQRQGSRSFVDYGCNGETSAEFVGGSCPSLLFPTAVIRHDYYSGPQLTAAINFIKAHPGDVGPVSLDLGADDMIPVVNTDTCKVDLHEWNTRLSALDQRLTKTILPQLKSALTNSQGALTGDLMMMNYYDPFANTCPKQDHFIVELNQHLAADAASQRVPIVNVYADFHDAQTPNPTTCSYTWMCSPVHSIHPNTTGYGVITHLFERTIGY